MSIDYNNVPFNLAWVSAAEMRAINNRRFEWWLRITSKGPTNGDS